MFELEKEPDAILYASGIKPVSIFETKVCGVLLELPDGTMLVPFPGEVLHGLARTILGMVAAHPDVLTWGAERTKPQPPPDRAPT